MFEDARRAVALAKQEAGSDDVEAVEADVRKCPFDLALEAQIGAFRAGVGTDRGDGDELARSGVAGGTREGEQSVTVDRDEGIRAGTTVESLARLRPGTDVTARNWRTVTALLALCC